MGSEWRTVRLGDEVTLQRGYDISRAELEVGPVPVIASSGTIGFHDKAVAEGPGVLLGRKGTLGTVWYTSGPYWPHSTALWVRDFHGNDPLFVYYFFKGFPVRQLDVGTANPTLNRNHVHPLPAKWPPLDEQRRIACILGALDEKIELNRRMSRTLDALAQSVFESAFADVQARVEDGALGDLVDVVRVGVAPGAADSDVPYVALEHLDSRSTSVARWSPATAATSTKSAFRRGDVLFGKLRPYFHKVALARFDGVCSTDILVLRPKTEDATGFVLGCVNSDAFIDAMTASSDGTKMPRAKWEDVVGYPIASPAIPVMSRQWMTVRPMLLRNGELTEESRRLVELRDALLPPLLSGEISVA